MTIRDRIARAILSALLAWLATTQAFAQQFVDAGFSVETIATLPPYQPLGITFAADGRAFIWQDNGLVRIYKPGVGLLPTPFIDLRGRVNTVNDRGFLGFALDPAFLQNGRAYLLYTYENQGRPDDPGDRTSRLTRVTTFAPGGDVADPSTEVVLLGSIGDAPCSRFPLSADCIGIEADSHTIGTVRFAPDGTLFVSSGDGAGYAKVEPLALRAQNLDSLNGKLLRINPDGTAPFDNPFYDGTNSNRSKVYAYGLRNPYRFALSPTGEPWLGDVGWGSWEEINAGRGANFGWPCFEGVDRQPSYAAAYPECRTLSPNAVTLPRYTYPHTDGSNAVVMGTFYTGSQFPADYRGNLFFADYPTGRIQRARIDASARITEVLTFATAFPGPVSIEQGPEGSLYVISLPTGEVRRINAQAAPIARASATPSSGPTPLTVQFSSTGSQSSDGVLLRFQWDFGDGRTSTAANPRIVFRSSTGPLQRVVTLTVTDARGRTATDRLTITVGAAAPTATIVSPADGARVVAESTVVLQATAIDPDGTLPASAFQWQVLLHHDDHIHPYATLTGPSASFIAESHGNGQETYFYEAILTVTDASGLTDTRSAKIFVDAPVSTPVALPAPWRTADVGTPARAGMAAFDTGRFSVAGGGRDIWAQVDAFRFVHQPASGAQSLVARVASLAAGDEWAKAGVMFRQSLAADAAHAMVVVSPGNGIAFQRRAANGGLTTHTPGPRLTAPAWVRLDRDGDRVTAYWSANGLDFTAFGADTLALGAAALAGLAVTSHDDTALAVAAFESVRLDTRAPTTTTADVYLSDLPTLSATNGWGPFERDRSNGELGTSDGRPLSIGGTRFARGLGVHASSDLRFDLGARYARFRASLGVDDEVGGNGSVVFSVFGDGRLLYGSAVRRGGQPAEAIDLDVAGVVELRLAVSDGGDNDAYDHADWADARVVPPAAAAAAGAATLGTATWREVP